MGTLRELEGEEGQNQDTLTTKPSQSAPSYNKAVKNRMEVNGSPSDLLRICRDIEIEAFSFNMVDLQN